MTPPIKQELPTLMQRSLWRWLAAAAFDWACVVAVMLTANHLDHPVTWILAGFAIGVLQHALGLLGHDGTHRLICRDKKLNDWLNRLVIFWPVGGGADNYFAFHIGHHKRLGTDADPELAAKATMTPHWDLPLSRARLIRYVVMDLLFLNVPHFVRIADSFRPKSARDKLGVTVVWGTAIALLAWAGAWWVIPLWLLPVPSVGLAMTRLRIWSEHAGADGTWRFRPGLLTRTLFLHHNTWCHWEHHRWPAVPFYNLPRLRALADGPPVIPSSGALFEQLEAIEDRPRRSAGAGPG